MTAAIGQNTGRKQKTYITKTKEGYNNGKIG